MHARVPSREVRGLATGGLSQWPDVQACDRTPSLSAQSVHWPDETLHAFVALRNQHPRHNGNSSVGSASYTAKRRLCRWLM